MEAGSATARGEAARTSVVAGLLGPIAIAIYAVVISVSVWIAWYWLLRRG